MVDTGYRDVSHPTASSGSQRGNVQDSRRQESHAAGVSDEVLSAPPDASPVH